MPLPEAESDSLYSAATSPLSLRSHDCPSLSTNRMARIGAPPCSIP
ncbi:hypothetical protein [Streptomyces narbonensis]